ncbi:hypothetical protein GCM10008934_15920 [Virgibacillus salarius]
MLARYTNICDYKRHSLVVLKIADKYMLSHEILTHGYFNKLRKYKISAMTALSQVVILKC